MTKTLTIMADYGGAYCWLINGDAELRKGVGSCCDLPKIRRGGRMHPHPLTRAFEDWQREFDRTIPGNLDGFEREAFDHEGIELAKQLKKSVGDEYRVIYEKPYEDPDHEIDERSEIMPDGSLFALPCRRELHARLNDGAI